MAPAPKPDILPGTLDMLILKTVSLQSMHGYGIAQHIERVTDRLITVEEGSLYPALQRMRQKAWIRAEWKRTPNNQRARYYTITDAGRKRLDSEEASFAALVTAIRRIMKPT